MHEEFNPEIHICKFGFLSFGFKENYKILGNLYLMEISFVFPKESFGFRIQPEQLETLLPLIRWEDFKQLRNQKTTCQHGYRDEYFFQFWCLSESGYPLIRERVDEFFNLPHEKLLDWIRQNFADNKKIRKKQMLW
ncbi:MAG: hypothetical protein IJ644_04415 [Oscillospiraceae bacterium]|nr:hypothetical protein [Oscillospiraceae bacterium]